MQKLYKYFETHLANIQKPTKAECEGNMNVKMLWKVKNIRKVLNGFFFISIYLVSYQTNNN